MEGNHKKVKKHVKKEQNTVKCRTYANAFFTCFFRYFRYFCLNFCKVIPQIQLQRNYKNVHTSEESEATETGLGSFTSARAFEKRSI